MLIDKFLPDYQIGKKHEVIVNAPINEVYEAAISLDMSKSQFIRWLFQFRGLHPSTLTLQGLQKIGFTMLRKKSKSGIYTWCNRTILDTNGENSKGEAGSISVLCSKRICQSSLEFQHGIFVQGKDRIKNRNKDILH